MITEAEVPPAIDLMDCAGMLAIGAEMQMSPPTEDELVEARELACALMQHKVVPVETLWAVHAVQPAATLVFKEDGRITGVAGQLLLRPSAVRPLFEGRFDAVDVNVDFLSRDGEPVALGYGWGIVASTKPGGAAVSNVGRHIKARLFPHIATFTRAVTPIGRHVALTRYGYQPLRHPDDELMINLPAPHAERRAA